MRFVVALMAFVTALPALAQQSGTAQFDPPNVCVVAGTFAPSSDPASTCAPSSYRLYIDGALVGNINPGGALTFPSNTGNFVVGLEPVGARGPGPRVSLSVPIGAVTVPGPVRNFTIALACATTSPPTCTVSVSEAP